MLKQMYFYKFQETNTIKSSKFQIEKKVENHNPLDKTPLRCN